MLENPVAQLVGDVTVLLDLNEGSSEDRQQPFGHMGELPHCLHISRDRREVLGVGCPETCGWACARTSSRRPTNPTPTAA